MKKTYIAQDVRYFRAKNGELKAWVPDLITFVELDDDHRELLDIFRVPLSVEAAIKRVAGDVNERRGQIENLLAFGLLRDVQQATTEYPLEFDFLPEISAFRVVMTEACNFACPGCFSTTALRQARHPLRSMSMHTAELLFNGMIPYGKERSILIHFFGGEPLIRFEVIKRAVEILDAATVRGDMVRPEYAITTNGSLVTDEVISFFKAHHFQVGVSIEGEAALHDSIRVTRTGEATFELVAANYDRMHAAGLDLHILTTPYRSWQGDMEEKVAYLMERFPSPRLTINTPFAEDSLGWETNVDYADRLLGCEEIGRERNVSLDSALTPVVAAIAEERRRESPQATEGSRVMVSVDPQGVLYRSSQKWWPTLKIGSIEEARNTRWKVRRAPACATCAARHLCGGPNEEYQIFSGELLDPHKCQFYERVLEKLAADSSGFEAPEEECPSDLPDCADSSA